MCGYCEEYYSLSTNSLLGVLDCRIWIVSSFRNIIHGSVYKLSVYTSSSARYNLYLTPARLITNNVTVFHQGENTAVYYYNDAGIRILLVILLQREWPVCLTNMNQLTNLSDEVKMQNVHL